MGRQHQGMDRPGVRQVQEGSGEKGKMEKTSCKIICGAPTTLVVKGLMMMLSARSLKAIPQAQPQNEKKWRSNEEKIWDTKARIGDLRAKFPMSQQPAVISTTLPSCHHPGLYSLGTDICRTTVVLA